LRTAASGYDRRKSTMSLTLGWLAEHEPCCELKTTHPHPSRHRVAQTHTRRLQIDLAYIRPATARVFAVLRTDVDIGQHDAGESSRQRFGKILPGLCCEGGRDQMATTYRYRFSVDRTCRRLSGTICRRGCRDIEKAPLVCRLAALAQVRRATASDVISRLRNQMQGRGCFEISLGRAIRA
jgi:hypothetical protein